jgi:lysophospholipase L1-like esterase
LRSNIDKNSFYLKKLLVRGGSIPAGHGVNKSYVDSLKESLAPKGIEVINRSRYGETSFDGIGTFHEDIASFEPDILLLHYGVDDAFQYVYRSEFQENLVQIIRLARRLFNPVIFLATSHTFDNPNDMKAVHIFNRSLNIVASDLNCGLIPVNSYWAGYLDEHNLCNKDLVLTDTRYPNEKGHQVIAQAVINFLGKMFDHSQ